MKSCASDLSRIASESANDFPFIDSIRLARYVKLQETSIDGGGGDQSIAALLVGKIKVPFSLIVKERIH